MTSTIDRTRPLFNDERGWFNIRKNFNAAANDIEALQAASGGAAAGASISVIGKLLGYDYSVGSSDTPLTVSIPDGTPYVITHVLTVNATGQTAPLPGYPIVELHTAPAAGGNKVMNFNCSFYDPEAIQWNSLSANNVDLHFITTSTLYLYVATPPSATPTPALVDVYVLGFQLG